MATTKFEKPVGSETFQLQQQVSTMNTSLSTLTTKVGNVGSTDLQTQVNTLNSNIAALSNKIGDLEYLALGGTLADVGAAWDAITVYDKLLVGTFSGSGLWMYMGYKYSGSKYGMMWAQRFGDWEINILSVNNGNKHIGKTALQSS